MSEKMKRLKLKMEVQEITFNYFARPQPRDLNFYVMMMMAIQKILLSVVSKFVVGVWDGLDACEISRPEILSQSAPAHTCGTVDSTRGVHLIKYLHIALANKPLQICFQLTVDPKPRLHRS